MATPSFAHLLAQVSSFAPEGTFTVEEALVHGISRRRLARAAESGSLHRVARGRYAMRADRLDLARHHIGLLRDRGVDAVIGGVSAANMWGVPVFGSRGPVRDHPLCLYVPLGAPVRRGTRNGVRLQTASLGMSDVTECAGVPVTRPLRTALDVSRELGRCRASALIPLCGGLRAEAAVRLDRGARLGDGSHHGEADVTEHLRVDCTLRATLLRELEGILAREPLRGSSWSRRVLGDVEPLVETALEGLAWAVLTGADIPRPCPQVWVTGRSGKHYRVDFLIGDRVVLEADGAIKYAAQTPWEEKRRQADLEAAGYWVVRCTWEELVHRPHEVVARIVLALSRAR